MACIANLNAIMLQQVQISLLFFTHGPLAVDVNILDCIFRGRLILCLLKLFYM